MRPDTAPYSLHRRDGIFYVQFRNQESRKWTNPKSTGTKDKATAFLLVSEWMRDGIPQSATETRRRTLADCFSAESTIEAARRSPLTPEEAARIVDILRERGLVQVASVRKGPGDVDFIDFLAKFWDFDRSEYVADKLAHGQKIGKRRCYDMTCRLNLNWKPSFAGKTLAEITKADLKAFSAEIARKGLAPASINRILDVASIALSWAHENELIAADPAEGLRRFSGARAKRGVLEPEEVAALFADPWEDERSHVGNLIAATTGLRAGEVLALRAEDVGTDRLFVRHAWAPKDGLKGTKTGEEREVPLLAEVRAALLALASRNPWGPKGFIFYSAKPDRPMDIQRLLNPLIEQFIRMKAGTESAPEGTAEARAAALAEWRSRNLTFHGWRHFYSARMADLIDARKIMLATGHKTQSVFDAYASHALAGDFDEVGQASRLAFGKVIGMPERKRSKVG